MTLACHSVSKEAIVPLFEKNPWCQFLSSSACEGMPTPKTCQNATSATVKERRRRRRKEDKKKTTKNQARDEKSYIH